MSTPRSTQAQGTTPHKSILVGPTVADRYPKFIGRLGREHRIRIVGINDLLTQYQTHPWDGIADLMLVDRGNLLLTMTWLAALDHLGAETPPVLVVQHESVVALRVVAAHAGAAGVIDPLADWGTIAVTIDHATSHPGTADDNDRIWTEVDQPFSPRNGDIQFRDSVDRDIVDLVSFGLSDREVAAAVHLAEQTVRNRLSRILEHSDLKNRTQLAVARRRHLEAVAMATMLAVYRSHVTSNPNGRLPDQNAAAPADHSQSD